MFDEVHPAKFYIEVGVLPKSGQEVKFSANAQLLEELAEFYQLADVQTYDFSGKVARWQKDGAKFVGTLTAQFNAYCVVSGNRVPQLIEETLELHFAPENSKFFKPFDVKTMTGGKDVASEIVMDVSDEDPPEPFSGTMADLGSLIAEHFSLALDPFPRSENAALEAVEGDVAVYQDDDGEDEANSNSPFSVLAQLKETKDE